MSEKPTYQALENEIQRLQQELRQAQKMEPIGTLCGCIAHDFNNILSAIMGYTELCLFESKPERPIAGNLEKVLQASKRAKDLIGQLLKFSREKEKERRPVELNLIVREVAALIRGSFSSCIDIRINYDTGENLILADPVQLHQVLMNLCANAYHAMQPKGGCLAISVSGDTPQTAAPDHALSAADGVVRLTVSDTGVGILPQHIERIFHPYFTTKTHGEGTGLGLSVVRGIIKNHDGEIMVKSEPGVGTCFDIYLPKVKQPAETKVHTALILPNGQERVLLVDDEPFILEITAAMLRSLGYKVDCERNGADVLEQIRDAANCVDLIITDYSMPGMNGIEMASAIRDIKQTTPIVLCSGYGDALDEKAVRRAGIDAIMRKPVLRADLAVTVRNCLDKRIGDTLV